MTLNWDKQWIWQIRRFLNGVYRLWWDQDEKVAYSHTLDTQITKQKYCLFTIKWSNDFFARVSSVEFLNLKIHFKEWSPKWSYVSLHWAHPNANLICLYLFHLQKPKFGFCDENSFLWKYFFLTEKRKLLFRWNWILKCTKRNERIAYWSHSTWRTAYSVQKYIAQHS